MNGRALLVLLVLLTLAGPSATLRGTAQPLEGTMLTPLRYELVLPAPKAGKLPRYVEVTRI